MAIPSVNIRDILVAETELVYKKTLFIGREPPTPHNVVTIFDVPDSGRQLILSRKDKNGNLKKYDYTSFQTRIRNKNYDKGLEQAEEIVDILHGRGNEMIGADEIKVIKALDSPSLLDWDENDRARFVVNFGFQRIPST